MLGIYSSSVVYHSVSVGAFAASQTVFICSLSSRRCEMQESAAGVSVETGVRLPQKGA